MKDILLHMLGAVVIMLVGWWLGYLLVAFITNTALWPGRELWQKRHAIRDFLSIHVTLEWAAPIAVAAVMYGVLK